MPSWRALPFVLPAAALLALVLAWPTHAHAAETKPLYVLEIDSDDADEQADALTRAMRARVRATPGFALAETSQSLGTLIVALKCPTPPDAPCLEKIAEVLRADRFVWGIMAHKADSVSVDVHLWERGKPDVKASEQYGDKLKDPEGEPLKKVATRLVERLTGSTSTGTIMVRIDSASSGTVLVDNVEKGRLEQGVARIDVPSGPHTIEVRVPQMRAARQDVQVAAGATADVRMTLVPGVQTALRDVPQKSSPVRKGVEWGALALGAGFLVASGVEAILFAGGKDDVAAKADAVAARYGTPGADGRLRVDDARAVCKGHAGDPACGELNDQYDSQVGHRDRALIFAGVGGALAITGTVLILTDRPSKSTGERAARQGSVHVLPTLGGLSVSGTF
jgi:hypothetical protein